MLLHTLLATSCNLQEYALVVIRVFIGLTYIRHGLDKILRGKQEWLWLGEQMKHLGISWAPLFWGLAATCAEFFGGLFLTVGFATRIVSLFMAFTMFVATLYHINNKDPWGYISFPLSMIIIFVGFMIAGSGMLSIDNYVLHHISS